MARPAAACVALGAALNVAVAWAAVMWSPMSFVRRPAPPPLRAAMEETLRAEHDTATIEWDQFADFGYSEWTSGGWQPGSNHCYSVAWRTVMNTTLFEAGWPVRSVRSLVTPDLVEGEHCPGYRTDWPTRWRLPAGEIVSRGLATDDLPDALHARPGRRLPVVPIAAGFVIDTAVYAVAFAVVLSLIRRRAACRDIRRGFDVLSVPNRV